MRGSAAVTVGVSIRALMVFVFTCNLLLALSQEMYSLEVISPGGGHIIEEVIPVGIKADSMTQVRRIREAVRDLHKAGYLEAQVHRIQVRDSVVRAHLHLGNRYSWVKVRTDHIDAAFLRGVSPQFAKLADQPLEYFRVAELMDGILTNAENTGYPFARIWLDSLVVEENRVNAAVQFDPGRYVEMDSFSITGDVKLSQGFLRNYLGLRKAEPFSKQKLLEIPDKLRDLPFVTARKNPEIVFRGTKSRINLFLEKRNASRFDFLIGLQPQGTPGTPLVLTGLFKADLANQLGRGERLSINFERLRARTQRLNLTVNYPYLLDIPFGIDAAFDLFKNDTLFTDLQLDLGIQYYLKGINYVKAFWRSQSTNLLSVNASAILSTGQLPANLDLRTSNIGLELYVQRLDYRFNPRRGFSVFLRASAGLKDIVRNNDILALGQTDPDFDPDSLYNAIGERTNQYQLLWTLEYFLPLGQRSALRVANSSGFILNSGKIFNNELFRIGGIGLLRGFDEESLFVDRYSVFSGEFRFLLSQNSFFSAFLDYALIRNETLDPVLTDDPLGFGAGISFETPAGIFGLSAALGRQQGNPFDLDAAKIHFGYLNVF